MNDMLDELQRKAEAATHKERPILFSGPMIRAILAGTKTQTRRAVKRKASDVTDAYRHPALCPYGKPGDRLWVRESWAYNPDLPGVASRACFMADPEHKYDGLKWKPSIHMPRAVCRIVLEITHVRVERLQDISEANARAEGCKADEPETWWQGYKDTGEPLGLIHQQIMGDEPPDWMIEPHKCNPTPWLVRSAKFYYQCLWDRINGPGSWDANPWVWVVEFRHQSLSALESAGTREEGTR